MVGLAVRFAMGPDQKFDIETFLPVLQGLSQSTKEDTGLHYFAHGVTKTLRKKL